MSGQHHNTPARMTPERRAEILRNVVVLKDCGHTRHAAMFDDLLAELAAVEKELERERCQHAACLSIAEGATGWTDAELYGYPNSEAVKAVQRLRKAHLEACVRLPTADMARAAAEACAKTMGYNYDEEIENRFLAILTSAFGIGEGKP